MPSVRAARSPSVSGAPSSRVTTTMAGWTSLAGSSSCNRSTWVDCQRADRPVAETGAGLSGVGNQKTAVPTASAARMVSKAFRRPPATRVNTDIRTTPQSASI